MVFYTNLFVKKGMSGTTYGPFIFIRPTKKDDIGLLEHEKVHVRQFWKNPFFGILYALSKKKRFEYELEAYKVQAVYHPERIEIFAWLLANKYNLDVTQEEALKALKE